MTLSERIVDLLICHFVPEFAFADDGLPFIKSAFIKSQFYKSIISFFLQSQFHPPWHPGYMQPFLTPVVSTIRWNEGIRAAFSMTSPRFRLLCA